MRGLFDTDTLMEVPPTSTRRGAQITMTLPHEDLEAIDAIRGDVPRSKFMRDAALSGQIPAPLYSSIRTEAAKSGFTAEQLIAVWLDKHRRGE